jgi:predicted SnoaL-like aldol condensation-catalyzing enzyme
MGAASSKSSASDPVSVVLAWMNDVWNDGHVDRIPDLVSDPCTRHDPGAVHQITLTENMQRVVDGRAGYPGVQFSSDVTTVDGELVTSCYSLRWSGPEGVQTMSGIEVFRVVNGRITETWNVPPAPGGWL